jgi:hypothetical protein
MPDCGASNSRRYADRVIAGQAGGRLRPSIDRLGLGLLSAGAGGEQQCHERHADGGDGRRDQARAGEAVQEGEHRGASETMAGPGQPGVGELLGGGCGTADRSLGGCDGPRREPGSISSVSRLVYSDAATLPITATPRVPPNSLVEPLTAEAMPAFCFGTAPMMASVAGAWVKPIPKPSTTICAAMMP